MFHVVATYGTKPGMAEGVLDLLRTWQSATRREPGNVSYEFYRGAEDPTRIVILESYQDAEDFYWHRESKHFMDLGAGQTIPRLVSRHISTYTSVEVPHEAPCYRFRVLAGAV